MTKRLCFEAFVPFSSKIKIVTWHGYWHHCNSVNMTLWMIEVQREREANHCHVRRALIGGISSLQISIILCAGTYLRVLLNP
jgi:hypothetical protein